MGRRKRFDTETAVHQAMLLFWRQGYEASSVRDLCTAMGLQTGSFYATFGSKEELFRLALARYLRHISLPEPGPGAIRQYLDAVVADRAPRGCLLARSAMDGDALPAAARPLVHTGLHGLEDFFWAALGAHSGDRTRAKVLTTLAIGLQAQHRAGLPREQLDAIAASIVDTLDI